MTWTRKLAIVTIATILAGAAPALASPADTGRFQMSDGRRGWSDIDVRRTIRFATDRWDVPFTTVLAIAERESGLNERAVNSSSGACGIFQHIPTYWPGRVSNFNRHATSRMDVAPSCFNARSNVLVSVRMMGAGGWYHWG